MFIIKLLLLIVSDMLVRLKIIANILKFALLNGKVTIFLYVTYFISDTVSLSVSKKGY